MPGRNTEYSTTLFDNALSLPPSFWDAVKLNPGDANIISAHALKILSKELAGETSPFGHQLWIICGSEDVIDLVLSCTESAMGTHPIFIFSPHPFTHHDPHFLQPRMEHLVDALHRAIPYERVFSVFAPQLITTIFVSLWSELTQIPFYTEPYYAAKLSFCTKRSFVNRPMTIHPDLNYELRLAVEADIPEAAVLCHGFAQASVCNFIMWQLTQLLTLTSGTFRFIGGGGFRRSQVACAEQSALDTSNQTARRGFGDSFHRGRHSRQRSGLCYKQSILKPQLAPPGLR